MSDAAMFSTMRPMNITIYELRKNQMELDKRLTNLEMGLSHKPGYYTMGKWLRLTKMDNIHHDLANRLYTACSRLSKERGVPIYDVPDPEYGTSNLYHETILKEIIGVGNMYEED